jgi:hypothetical protein
MFLPPFPNTGRAPWPGKCTFPNLGRRNGKYYEKKKLKARAKRKKTGR